MAPNRFIDYFVVCGLGPELVSIEGQKGYHGTAAKYQPALLDQLPVKDHPDGGLPPQLPMCCLPGGVEFYVAGSSESDWPIPKTYPVVLTGEPVCISSCSPHSLSARSPQPVLFPCFYTSRSLGWWTDGCNIGMFSLFLIWFDLMGVSTVTDLEQMQPQAIRVFLLPVT